jgi:hypothetical protein
MVETDPVSETFIFFTIPKDGEIPKTQSYTEEMFGVLKTWKMKRNDLLVQ